MVRAKYNFNRVGVHGACFGGKIAMEAATELKRQYKRIDDVDDSGFLPDFTVTLYPQGTAIYRFPRHVPPAFSAVSRDDNCVGTMPAQMYNRRAARARAIHEIHIYPHGMHGWGTCEYYPFLEGQKECNWPNQLKSFLDRLGI